jgi:hypothetical protein
MSFQTLFPIILSNTDMSLWSQCQLRWFRERCQNLRRSSARNINLEAGGAFAKGMEVTRKAFYEKKLPSSEAVQLGYDEILKVMYERQATDDTLKSPERMALALLEYFKEFPLVNEEVVPSQMEDGSHGIEHKMTAELPILHPELNVPLIFKGKLDMLATSMGRTYIVDEKTTKAISYNQGDLLQTQGQFIGYAWLARQLGITVVGVKVRKVAIQIKEIKVKEFEVPITDFMINAWEQAMFQKVSEMVKFYGDVIKGTDFRIAFTPDYSNGCTAYHSVCPFTAGCTSKYGENFLATEFEQLVWDSEARQEVPLADFRTLIGL